MENKITCSEFGTIYNGQKAHLYTVSRKDISFCVSDFGCTITSLLLKNSDGSFTDVVLGFETLSRYADSWGSFGAVIGQYSNKIAGAKFELNGKTYNLAENIEGCCLHGGFPAWEKVIWNAKEVQTAEYSGMIFSRTFYESDQGFPGTINVEVEYTINDQNELKMVYRAVTDKDTPVSITNHSYFNLSGKGKVFDYLLKMNCDRFVETDDKGIPTGQLKSVKGTNFDFTQERVLTKKEDINPDYLGYDTCFVTPAFDEKRGIPAGEKKVEYVATLKDPSSGREMDVFTNQEGVQLYNAPYVRWIHGKNGFVYMPFMAVCLETQSFPDSPNQKSFPDVVLHPNEKYNAITIYKFRG